MKTMIQTISADNKLRDETEYFRWLSYLQKDSYVLLQQFHPKSSDILDLSLEFWKFYWLKIAFNDGEKIVAHGHAGSSHHSSHRFTKGIKTYINSDELIRATFYSRLVPPVNNLLPPFEGDYREYNSSPSFCTEPVYEPDWTEERHYLLQKLPRQDTYRKERLSLKQAFPTYSYKVSNGEIFVVFPGQEDLEQFLIDKGYQTFQYLYSEPLNY